ncbi:hypothetical protein [Methanobacterium formicicum]|jgi:hypothetical protein|uniref:Uncharacterized protein n=1 Tax=Methanobacterium formicicum TaxID=2162 RepID=A0A843ASX6_METFO|nr:hypothetical protein [Methanobacterium formicicum]MBF4474653.1 hypothetical protein [Methanobacterium formicicum]
MTAKSGIIEIIIGLAWIVVFILSLLSGMSSSVMYLFLGLFLIITGIFYYTKNYDKNLYRVIMVVLIGSMLIVFHRMFPLGEDTVVLVFVGLFTLLILLGVYLVPRKWEKYKKELEQ